jgi:hypothetical protein
VGAAGSARDQHGAPAEVQHLVGDAAQQQRAQVGAAAGAHHDQAGVQLLGQVGDDPGDVPYWLWRSSTRA